MIYALKKLDYAYFSSDNVETHIDDYSYSETNININVPLEVWETLELTGNINLNLNNAILIAQTITLDCPNVNANYNSTMAEIVC